MKYNSLIKDIYFSARFRVVQSPLQSRWSSFHHPQKKPCTHSKSYLTCPSPSPWQSLISLSVPMDLPIVNISHRWSHRILIHDLLCLASLTYVFEVFALKCSRILWNPYSLVLSVWTFMSRIMLYGLVLPLSASCAIPCGWWVWLLLAASRWYRELHYLYTTYLSTLLQREIWVIWLGTSEAAQGIVVCVS